ncbi:MAG: choice-of-anchor Q domain-containing protein [Nostoc sp.]
MPTFTVTNTNNSGAGSLRQAILDANALTGRDIIKFGGLFTDNIADTISLTGSSLTITDNLTIEGTGPSLLTIGKNSASRIFDISTGVTAAINGLTITNSYDQLGGGGAIYNSGVLTLGNNKIIGNTADNGGGIINNGTAKIKNSIIAGNNKSATNPINPDVVGNFTSNGYNLIGRCSGSTGFYASEELKVAIAKVLDLKLQNNGGLVNTHALVAGSPAINSGKNADIPRDTIDLDGDGNTTEPIPFDQRGVGFNRILGSKVDIGAFEVA